MIAYVIVFEEDSPLHIVDALRPDIVAKEGYALENWPEGKPVSYTHLCLALTFIADGRDLPPMILGYINTKGRYASPSEQEQSVRSYADCYNLTIDKFLKTDDLSLIHIFWISQKIRIIPNRI